MKLVPYEAKMGEYTLPAGLKEKLFRLSLEEQMHFFGTSESRLFENTGYTSRAEFSDVTPVEKSGEVAALLTHEGIIVGCLMEDWCGSQVVCFVNQCTCTYSTEENNGAGYKTRDDYTYFLALEEKHS